MREWPKKVEAKKRTKRPAKKVAKKKMLMNFVVDGPMQ